MPYGPYSTELLDEINLLREKEMLLINEEVVPVKRSGEVTAVERRNYVLTKKGREKCKEITKDIPEKTQISISKLKELYSTMALQELLDYVHNKYPSYQKKA